ncbi:hypothetical protein EDD21DRAFT_122307 [Dissophora ornata]|nr:hypothetical protein EDD21DRAFT_122307 [Dissophora ornata]
MQYTCVLCVLSTPFFFYRPAVTPLFLFLLLPRMSRLSANRIKKKRTFLLIMKDKKNLVHRNNFTITFILNRCQQGIASFTPDSTRASAPRFFFFTE